MKRTTLLSMLIFVFAVTFAQQPEVVIADFDGNAFPNVTFGAWSYNFVIDTVDNPVTDGINASATSVYFPSHYFYSSWGWLGAFLVFKGIPADMMNDNKYFYFETLIIQDTVAVADMVNISMRLKGEDGLDSDWIAEVDLPVEPGGENYWQSVYLEIPADILPVSYTWVELMTGPETATTAVYWDNYGFTSTMATGIKGEFKRSNFKTYLAADQLHVRFEKSTFVKNVQVYNINGALVSDQAVNAMINNQSMAMELDPGVYVVRVNSDTDSYTSKVVSQ